MDLKKILLKRLEEETTYEDSYGLKEVTEVIEEVFKEAKQCDIPVVVRSAYLAQHRETLVNHGLFDSEEKAKSYIKGSIHDFAIQKVDIA